MMAMEGATDSAPVALRVARSFPGPLAHDRVVPSDGLPTENWFPRFQVMRICTVQFQLIALSAGMVEHTLACVSTPALPIL